MKKLVYILTAIVLLLSVFNIFNVVDFNVEQAVLLTITALMMCFLVWNATSYYVEEKAFKEYENIIQHNTKLLEQVYDLKWKLFQYELKEKKWNTNKNCDKKQD